MKEQAVSQRKLPILLSLIFAIIATAASLMAIKTFAPSDGYLYALFLERSWIQFATTFFFWLVMSFLFIKDLAHLKERRAFNKAREITQSGEFDKTLIWTDASSVQQMYSDKLDKSLLGSQTVTRLFHALDRLQKSQSTASLEDYFRTRSDIDSEELDASYTAIRFLVWLIPTLGFIGTVMGIGTGIKGFSDIIANAGDFSQIREFLPVVTGHLGTAFDTTLLALTLSVVAIFYQSALHKKERQLLESLDRLCFDGICPLFREHSGATVELVNALEKVAAKLMNNMDGNRGSIEGTVRASIQDLGSGVSLKQLTEEVQNLSTKIDKLEKQLITENKK